MEAVRPYVEQLDAVVNKYWTQALGPQHELSKALPYVNPTIGLGFFTGYLLFVTVLCPIMYASGFKVSLKPVMRLYNLFMVVLSTYMGTYALYLAYHSNSSVWCVPLASGDAGAEMAKLVWIFTYSKTLEFFDSVSMAVEGRWRQLSFLHVYHHVSILAYWYAILWMAPGSDAYFSLAINSYIHVIMYGYYLLASFGYSPWWKFYITRMQILQFCSFVGQSIYVGYIRNDCDFPPLLAKGLMWYMFTLIALFLNFLIVNQYSKRSKKSGAVKKSQ
uniref:Elongation of fatty acids protein n=1 Tax=Erythrolobus australicus TaxID=1077150 RepID=A0A7S1TK56_9RHOD